MAEPSCTIEDVTDAFDPTSFDKQLGDLLVKCDSNASLYLTTVLDFLKRKSNFFKEGNAKARVLEALRQVTGEPEPPSGGLKGGFFGSKPAAKPAAAPKLSAQVRVPRADTGEGRSWSLIRVAGSGRVLTLAPFPRC